MKAKISLFSFFLFLTHLTFSQTVQEQRIPVPSSKIPTIVRAAFESKHPAVQLKSWYVTHLVYWENDVSSGWYSQWYGKRDVVVYRYEIPNYFEVEYNEDPGEVSRSIYNEYGFCYETRTRIKGLPINISDSLKVAGYGDWKMSVVIERIEKAGWPEPFYRVHLHKGARSRILRLSQAGEIIQEKRISEL